MIFPKEKANELFVYLRKVKNLVLKNVYNCLKLCIKNI